MNREGLEWIESFILKAVSHSAGPNCYYMVPFRVRPGGSPTARQVLNEVEDVFTRLQRGIKDVEFEALSDGSWRMTVTSTTAQRQRAGGRLWRVDTGLGRRS